MVDCAVGPGALLCWCRSSRKFGLSLGKWQSNSGNGGVWLHSLAPSCLPLILVKSHRDLPLQAIQGGTIGRVLVGTQW